ncbi:MAG: S1 RNA-binding domain-containing protein, partial [Pseudomonadota bacterium]
RREAACRRPAERDALLGRVHIEDNGFDRVALVVKQLAGDPLNEIEKFKKGDPVTAEVTGVQDGGIEVKIKDTDITSFIKRSDLSRDRSEQRPERYSTGDKVDAAVTQVDRAARKVTLSIKALEIAEEKEAVAQFGSSDSGASLGDILGAAIKRRGDDNS